MHLLTELILATSLLCIAMGLSIALVIGVTLKNAAKPPPFQLEVYSSGEFQDFTDEPEEEN